MVQTTPKNMNKEIRNVPSGIKREHSLHCDESFIKHLKKYIKLDRMLQFRWLRLFIRRNTSPIHVDRALQWKKRLSILYAVLAWHAFGGVLYMCYSGKRDWMRAEGYVPDVDVLPARSWAHTLGIPQAQVIQMSGFKIKGSYEIKEGEDLYIGTAAERTVGNEEAVSSTNDST